MKISKIILIITSFFTISIQSAAPASAGPAQSYAHEDSLQQIIMYEKDLKALDDYLEQNPSAVPEFNQRWARFSLAIDNADLPFFQYLLDKGVDINQRDQYGSTPLHNAIYHRQYESDEERKALLIMIKILVNSGANLEIRDAPLQTPLFHAIRTHDYEVVEFLLSQGANFNARDARGESSIDFARYQNPAPENILAHKKIMELLTTYKQSNLECIISQQTIRRKNAPEAMEKLLATYLSKVKKPSKLSKAQQEKIKAITQGLHTNNLEPLQDFINEYTKDINIQNEAGNSLLLLAVQAQNIEAVNLIIQKLIELDAQENNVNDRLIKALSHNNIDDNNAYDLALEAQNPQVITLLKPYYKIPERGPE